MTPLSYVLSTTPRVEPRGRASKGREVFFCMNSFRLPASVSVVWYPPPAPLQDHFGGGVLQAVSFLCREACSKPDGPLMSKRD